MLIQYITMDLTVFRINENNKGGLLWALKQEWGGGITMYYKPWRRGGGDSKVKGAKRSTEL